MLLNSTINLLLMASTTANDHNETLNSSMVIEIVSLLDEGIKFSNFIFYVSKNFYRDTHEVLPFLNEFWITFPNMPFMIIRDNPRPIISMLDTSALCLVMTTQWNDPILQVAALSLNRARDFRTIFLLFPTQAREINKEHNENIRLLYEWIWERRFTRTILITRENNIFMYDGYPDGAVINRTNDWKEEDFFKNDRKINLKGWQIKTPVRFDLPRVFCLRRSANKRGHCKLSGSSGKLYRAFVQHINGSLNETEMDEHEFEPWTHEELLETVESGPTEISVHSYSSLTNLSVHSSYPIGINDWCLMVPFRNNSPGGMSLQKSFQQNSWFLLCFAIAYITVGIWLCTPVQERDISLSFLEAVCSVLFTPPQKLLLLPYLRLRFTFLLLFVMGFFITNLYFSKMGTYLTEPSDENQIDTLQDIIDASLNIMLRQSEHEILNTINSAPDLLKLLIRVNQTVFAKHRTTFNTSYGYSVTSDRWNFLNKQQRYLKKPLFRLSSICVGPFYHVFPLQTNSDLLHPLQEFIMRVIQSGLLFFWQDEAFYDALSMGYVKILRTEYDFTPLSIEFFRSIFNVWCFGLALGLLAFILEFKQITFSKMSMWYRIVCCRCLKRK